MFFPKIALVTLIFLLETTGVYPVNINENLTNKTEMSISLKDKDVTDCVAICYRPISNENTCEKYGSESIGCLNYRRCLTKCEDDNKSKNKSMENN